MRFASPNVLWCLMVLPLMGVYLKWFRSDDIPSFRFSAMKSIAGLASATTLVEGVMALGLLRVLAISALIVALARPQKGLKSSEMTTKATDIMIVLDASRSMLSVDFKPDNRFAVAKSVIRDFIKGREYDRLGMVLFAQHAITQCPLTTDRTAILGILDNLNIGAIPPDQTAIGLGLATAVNRLKNSAAKSKVIILLTDGANNAGNIDPVTAAKTAAAFNIKIYSIGVGSPEGGLMPVNDPVFGQQYVRMANDIDEDMLLRVASESKGKYFRAKNSDALKTIFSEIDSMEKTDIKVKEFVDYEELYIWPLSLAMLLLILELSLNKTLYRTLP